MPESGPDHVRAVIGAGPGEQSLDQHRFGNVQVDGGVEGQIQPGADVGGRDGLRQGPGKPVQNLPLGISITTSIICSSTVLPSD